MQQLLLTTANLANAVTCQIAHVIRWLALIMVLMTISIVVLRYAFNVGAIPLQEGVMYLHGALFMLGIPYGVSTNTHVRVDIIYTRLTDNQRRYIDLAGHILFLVPVSIFIIVTSVPYVKASWAVLEGSAEVGGIPGVFLLKTLIPVMAALLLVQGFSQIVRSILVTEK